MIPQSFKDIISNVENAGFFQTLAMIIFILFFVVVVYIVINRPKKYYSEEENAPLEKDHDDDKFTL
ncbi:MULTISPECIES: CcoQ/FixQ family Cbb3-type cytochrome c oxidase assembly chaperone [Epilithonimonas]|uniref:CcoQ/FixQ family Cbb3-type cytochrome c oxidase assembly chaperone n=1 Tax=Epilithonimonas hispanica TaxID=358687 RepID=A0A3D9CZK9_9FLAO|nr:MULTISPECIES: CcoQ/FixQ family Cbb3-type cytochrome c oxidase assembly chaperone [Epilithonimonas]REC71196.1 CcoQ/FixQ family Cbb3-type cytochrome c oxidase assembly chaperone [Epilithonimonas hispanica]